MKNGWPVTRLGDLTNLVTKGTTPTSIGHEFVEEGINFIKVESITSTGQFIEEKFAHITPACHAVLGRSQLQPGDILFSIAGALGRTGFVTDDILPANTNQALAIIRLKRDVGVSPKFVLKALETGVVLEQIEKFKGGVAQQNLSLAQVRDFQIAIPPLAEQQRIVGLLDEAFEGLATAKANAEKNLQNARALFESHLQSVFTQRGQGWKRKPLGSLCELISGQHIDAKDYNTEGKGVGYLTGPSDFGFLNPVITKWSEHPKRMAKRGDILVTVKGSGVGKINLLAEEAVAISRQLMAVRATAADVNYLYAFLSTNFDHFQSLSTGAAIPGISREDVLDLMCPMPPPEEQQAIVKLIHALAEETQRLARLYERKHAALEALKKSLLHQAFTGEL